MILFDTKDYLKTRSVLNQQKGPLKSFYTKPFVIITDSSVRASILKKYKEFNENYFKSIRHRDLYQTCFVNLQTDIAEFKSSQQCLRRQSSFNLFYDITLEYFFFKKNRLNYKICEEIEFKTYLMSVVEDKSLTDKSVVLVFARLYNLDVFKKPKVISSYSAVILLAVADIIDKFRPKIREHNGDIIFGFLGSEDSILTNKSSTFIMNEIIRNQQNTSGKLTLLVGVYFE